MVTDTACTVANDVGCAGFHFIQIVWVIAIGIAFNVAPLASPEIVGATVLSKWFDLRTTGTAV